MILSSIIVTETRTRRYSRRNSTGRASSCRIPRTSSTSNSNSVVSVCRNGIASRATDSNHRSRSVNLEASISFCSQGTVSFSSFLDDLDYEMTKKVLYNVDGSVMSSKNEFPGCVQSSGAYDTFLMKLTCTYVRSFPVIMSGRLIGGAPGFEPRLINSEGGEAIQQCVSVTSRIIAWLQWAFAEENDMDDDSSVSTAGTSHDDIDVNYPAVDLIDKLAALFMNEGLDSNLNKLSEGGSLARILGENCDTKDAFCTAAISLDENTSQSLTSRIARNTSSDETRLPLNLDAFLYDETLTHSRIDYNINQMDITKMIMNASKHLNLKSIHELPTRVYQAETSVPYSFGESWHVIMDKSENEVSFETECVICLEKFQCGDKLRVLPCGHQFHIGCIDHWLLGTYSDEDCITTGCPTCKKNVNYGSNSEISDDGIACIAEGDKSFPSWTFFKLGSILSKSSVNSCHDENENCS